MKIKGINTVLETLKKVEEVIQGKIDSLNLDDKDVNRESYYDEIQTLVIVTREYLEEVRDFQIDDEYIDDLGDL